jgi:hypothetical protein
LHTIAATVENAIRPAVAKISGDLSVIAARSYATPEKRMQLKSKCQLFAGELHAGVAAGFVFDEHLAHIENAGTAYTAVARADDIVHNVSYGCLAVVRLR